MKPSEGVTESERYLTALARNTFLSLWSYPNVYRDQGLQSQNVGKELCDLIVVCDEDIVVFSDKYCKFPSSSAPHTDWNRWFKRAITHSAKQANGAERWLRSYSDRVYLDPNCTQPFPYTIPCGPKIRYHIVVVAHGCMERCAAEVGGSGSLGIDSSLKGKEHFVNEGKKLSFCIGDIHPDKTFVHVLTDVSLDIVLRTLDTITDFLAYLRKKENLLRSGYRVIAAGEEDLMALYLKDTNEQGHHDFTFPRQGDVILLEDGHWENFCGRPERARQIEADKISYAWDLLIEKFAHHAREGTQYHTNELGIENTERILRFMALESRTARRSLSKALLGIIKRSHNHERATRYVLASSPEHPYYVLMALAKPDHISHENYRDVRLGLLELCCMTLKLLKPEAHYVIGIATEAGIENEDRSEDAIYFDAREWSEEDATNVRRKAKQFGILEKYEEFHFYEAEYPTENDAGSES